MINISSVSDAFWKSLNLQFICRSNNGLSVSKMWVLVSTNIGTLSVISCSEQQITIQSMMDNTQFSISFVYASTSYIRRRELWAELSCINDDLQGPWLVVGDFNATLGAHEQIGGCLPIRASCFDFQNMIDNCHLLHLPSRGLEFSWSSSWTSRGLIQRKLDRALCNIDWSNNWNSHYQILPRTSSDHSPLVISCLKDIYLGPKPF